MPRVARLIIDNSIWHIFNRGNAKQEIFHQESDFEHFRYILAYYKVRYGNNFKLYHHCLMPNHFHFEAEIKEGRILPKIMHDITQTYTNYHHQNYRTVGYLWQGRYKNMIVEKGDYHQKLGAYIERNPVRAGLVERPEDWKYSSYRYYAFGKPIGVYVKVGGVKKWVSLVDEDPFYLELGSTPGERQKNYRQLVGSLDDEIVREELGLKERKLIIGSTGFKEKMAEFFRKKGIEVNLRPRGRPPKS